MNEFGICLLRPAPRSGIELIRKNTNGSWDGDAFRGEKACFMGHRDDLPVAVSRGNFFYEDRGGFLIDVFRRERGEADNDAQKGNCEQCRSQSRSFFHRISSCASGPSLTNYPAESASGGPRFAETPNGLGAEKIF